MKKTKSSNKREGNVFDRIFRENADPLFIPIIEEQLGKKIKSYKALPEKFQKTVEREVDFLYDVTFEDGTRRILHLEFQTEDDKQMIYRMGFYHGLAWYKYKTPIWHVVIYLGKGEAKMRTQLTPDEIFDGFDLINIHQLNTETLLSSQVPEIILLALLSDFEPQRIEAVLRLIIKKLKKVSRSKSDLSKYLQQLIILSRLRNFDEEATKIIEAMPVIYDIETDYLYKRGLGKGREEQRKEGLEKQRKQLEETVTRCLEQGLDYPVISAITGLTETEIKEIDEKRKSKKS